MGLGFPLPAFSIPDDLWSQMLHAVRSSEPNRQLEKILHGQRNHEYYVDLLDVANTLLAIKEECSGEQAL